MEYYVSTAKQSSKDILHYGIPGMQWGVRRFQNKDGSLTAIGAIRYGGDDSSSGSSSSRSSSSSTSRSNSSTPQEPEEKNKDFPNADSYYIDRMKFQENQASENAKIAAKSDLAQYSAVRSSGQKVPGFATTDNDSDESYDPQGNEAVQYYTSQLKYYNDNPGRATNHSAVQLEREKEQAAEKEAESSEAVVAAAKKDLEDYNEQQIKRYGDGWDPNGKAALKYYEERLDYWKKHESKLAHSDDFSGYFAKSESDYLAHYGILGMKWGVRRYQNPDGTLTEAGKKRYMDKVYKVVSDYNEAKDRQLKAERAYNEYSRKTTRKSSTGPFSMLDTVNIQDKQARLSAKNNRAYEKAKKKLEYANDFFTKEGPKIESKGLDDKDVLRFYELGSKIFKRYDLERRFESGDEGAFWQMLAESQGYGQKYSGFNFFSKTSSKDQKSQPQTKPSYDSRYDELMKQNQDLLKALMRDTEEDVRKWKT